MVLVVALGSATFAHSGALEIDGLQPSYSDITEVRLWLFNAGAARVWLNSFNLDRIDVERQAESSGEWILGDGFRCANAGAGTPFSLPPGGSLEIRPLSSGAFDSHEAPQYFEADKGGARYPIPGRYRISASYSVERWASIAEIPKNVEVVVSTVFEVKSRGR